MEKTVNQRIIDLRKSKNLTQTDFAKKIGITQTSLSQIENGGGMTSKTLQKIMNCFDVRSEWLIYGEGDMFKSTINETNNDLITISRDVFFTIKGVLIGKLGKNTYENEIEPFFPKFEAYSIYSEVYA